MTTLSDLAKRLRDRSALIKPFPEAQEAAERLEAIGKAWDEYYAALTATRQAKPLVRAAAKDGGDSRMVSRRSLGVRRPS